MRALVGRDGRAGPWLQDSVSWPTPSYAEVTHVCCVCTGTTASRMTRAYSAVDALHALHADAHPVESLVRGAWDVALERS